MTICVDASLAAKWLFPEEYSERALALAAAQARAGQRIVGPPLLPIEVANVVRRWMLREGADLAKARRLLAQFFAFPVTIHTPAALTEQALVVADTYGLPALYDAQYVALAHTLSCDLWTDDRRLLRILDGRLPFVRWIGTYS